MFGRCSLQQFDRRQNHHHQQHHAPWRTPSLSVCIGNTHIIASTTKSKMAKCPSVEASRAVSHARTMLVQIRSSHADCCTALVGTWVMRCAIRPGNNNVEIDRNEPPPPSCHAWPRAQEVNLTEQILHDFPGPTIMQPASQGLRPLAIFGRV